MFTQSPDGRAWRLAVSTLLLSVGCNAVFDITEGKPFPESCLLASDCPGSQICLFRVCSAQCHADQDCPNGGRCVQTAGDAACVAEGAGSCDSRHPCPDGLSCIGAACRNACQSSDDCLSGQACQLGACTAAGDEPESGAEDVGGAGGEGGEPANCDGEANDDCPCVRGAMRPCSEGGSLGNCAFGSQECLGHDGWSECDVAAEESDSCYELGDDASCDGVENDGCECVTGDERKCSEGKLFGACADGIQTCDAAGQWGACSITPAPDTCAPDNDDDCDGNQNEGCTCETGKIRLCEKGGYVGSCAKGAQTCEAGEWGPCSIEAKPDTCVLNNDDDCDGEVNEGCSCIDGEEYPCGPCGDGKRVCANGKSGAYLECKGASEKVQYYLDQDGDGYGTFAASMTRCGAAPDGYVTGQLEDCCDGNGAVHPGADWTDVPDSVCGRGFDVDCSGTLEAEYTTTSCEASSDCWVSLGDVCPWHELPGCGQTLDQCSCRYDQWSPVQCSADLVKGSVLQRCH